MPKSGFVRLGEFESLPVFIAISGPELPSDVVTNEGLPDDCFLSLQEGLFRREVTPLYQTLTPFKKFGKFELMQIGKNYVFRGPKIPYTQFAQAVSFLQSIWEKQQTEARLDLFFDPEKRVYQWVPPRQMVTTAGIQYDRMTERVRDLFARGYLQVGSMHSHPGCSAGFSSTDHGDEEKNNGLHITVSGSSRAGKTAIDCRLVVNDETFALDLWEVVDLSVKVQFPEWWNKMITKGASQPLTGFLNGTGLR